LNEKYSAYKCVCKLDQCIDGESITKLNEETVDEITPLIGPNLKLKFFTKQAQKTYQV